MLFESLQIILKKGCMLAESLQIKKKGCILAESLQIKKATDVILPKVTVLSYFIWKTSKPHVICKTASEIFLLQKGTYVSFLSTYTKST